jgi:hypothetical protein
MDEQVSAQRARLEDEAEALVSAVAETDVTQEHSLWASFAEAATVEAFCRSWLALQCRMLGGVRAGMVLLGPADRGPFRPVAAWPEGRRNLKHLTKTAERTLAERRGLVSRGEPDEGEPQNGYYEIGYPIEVRGALHGAAVLEVASKSEAKLQGMMRQLHWGAAWLELLISGKRSRPKKKRANAFRRRLTWWPLPSGMRGFCLGDGVGDCRLFRVGGAWLG